MASDDSQAMENLETAMAMSEPISSETQTNDTKMKAKKANKKMKKQRVEATIQVLQGSPDLAPPIVGYFPSGFDPKSGVPTTARAFRHANRPKRLQLVVTPNRSGVDFVGTNYSGEAEAGQQHFSYGLGVFDKETQTLKIVPIASNKIFRLEPKVRGLDLEKKEPESLEGEKSRSESNRKLIQQFGTKSAIKEAKKLEELRKEDDPEAKKDIEEQLKLLDVKPEEGQESTQIRTDLNVPPYNPDAISPKEAYPLNKIILNGDWEFLKDVYRTLQEEAEGSWKTYPSFIGNRIKKLREIEDEEEKERLCGVMSYITHLLKFKDDRTKSVKSENDRNPPRILQQRFSNLFSGDTGSEFLSSEKSKFLIFYVLVLTLHVDEFQTNLTDIVKDLRMSSMSVRGLYEHLGCKLIRLNNLWYATLPVPLRFPDLRQKRKRR